MTPVPRELAYAALQSVLTRGKVRATAIETIAGTGVP